ncbi:peroxiredoxin [Candidatus Thorarchaeota archaeon]|nr:MAG: peroxiredoxin [Candidatus Thorarchaeota archaeon]
MLTIGEKFPEMEVDTTFGPLKLPDHYKGKWFILFSHPGDFTPVCTTEFVAFAKRHEDFKKLNTELIGLSVDSTISHMKWVEWIEDNVGEKINYPVIGDPMGTVSQTLGLIHAQSSTETVRAVYIVDPNQVIRAIMFYPLELGRNIDEFLRMVKAFQVGGEYKAALPANWPNNEIVGEHVIVPPPKSMEAAAKRTKEYECLDWWLCHKEVPKEEASAARKFLERAAKVPE